MANISEVYRSRRICSRSADSFQYPPPRRVAVGPDPLRRADGETGGQGTTTLTSRAATALFRRPQRSSRPARERAAPESAGRRGIAADPRPAVGRLVTAAPVFLPRLQDDRLQVARNARPERRGPWRLLSLDLLDQLEPVGRVESRAEGEQLVEGQAQGVDVGPAISLAAEPLGGHVPQRAQDVAGRVRPSSLALARPKSVIQTTPWVSSSKFDGLMSRWTMPSVGVGQPRRHLPADVGRAAIERPPARLDRQSGDPPGKTTDEAGLDTAAEEFSLTEGLRSHPDRGDRCRGCGSLPRGGLGFSGAAWRLGRERPVSSEWAIRLTGRARDGAAAVGPDGIGRSGGSGSRAGPLQCAPPSRRSSSMTRSSPWPWMNCMA